MQIIVILIIQIKHKKQLQVFNKKIIKFHYKKARTVFFLNQVENKFKLFL